MPKTQWKSYFGIIFNRSTNRFRGMHQGYNIHEDRAETVKYCMNIGSEKLNVLTRVGSRRRNQVDGEIHQVDILPTAKMLAIGTKVFTAPPNELWDHRYRYSQFEHLAYDPTTWSELDDVKWEDMVPSNTF
jgi:hypothetical protein